MPSISKQVVKTAKKKKSSNVGLSAWDRIEKLEENDEEFLKILVYGKSGTGKTTFWGSFPGPILCMVCSGGNKSGELKSLKSPEFLKRGISMVPVNTGEEFYDIVEKQAETGRFKTIVLDHVTSFQDRILAQILEVDRVPEQKYWGLATREQYGECSSRCKELIAKMLDLSDCHIVIIGQERVFNDSEEENSDSEIISPYVAVAGGKSFVGWINPACDYVCQTIKIPKMIKKTVTTGKKTKTVLKRGKGVEYAMRTAPHDIITTKFRVPKGRFLPDMVIDPTFDKIQEVIKGLAKV